MNSGIKPQGSGIKLKINQFLSGNVSHLLTIAGARLYKRFVKASKDVRGSQQAVLQELMEYSANTTFGREHNFSSVKNYDDFKKALPVMDYEDFRPYIDRHANGEENVLFPGKPLMYTRTSGTTALPKLIPVTPYNFERAIKNRSKLWFYGLLQSYPGIFRGKDMSLVSPGVEGYTPDGTPFGSLSGYVYQNIPEFMKLVHTIPYETVTIKDYQAKVYTIVRFALPSDVTCILTGNPSSVVNLLKAIDRWKEDIIRDVRDGTLNKNYELEPSIRSQCEALLEPAKEKAAQLEGFVNQFGTIKPEHYWPNLELIHTWTNGNCRLVIPKLKAWLKEDFPILDFGYIASEVTACDLIDPKTNGSILQVQNVFFEFTPYEEGSNPTTFLQAHELEIGGKYFIYVSTFGGLFRYDMNDVIEMMGWFNETPIIRFLFKGKGITSLQGEKLSESQFIEAMNMATDETGMNHEFFVGLADAKDSVYKLYVEFSDHQGCQNEEKFAKSVNDALCKVNLEYEAKFETDRLKQVEVIQLGKNSFDKYRALRLEEGALEGQLKWMNLSSTDAEISRMDKLVRLCREEES